MRFLIQKVKEASVICDEKTVGSIQKGLLVFVGIQKEDSSQVISVMLEKLFKLRIFEDAQDKLNLSLQDVKGDLLIVSQFTLYADCKGGNRPSFIKAASFDQARVIYEDILKEAKKLSSKHAIHMQEGVFGGYMKVSLINDGPITIMLDSSEL